MQQRSPNTWLMTSVVGILVGLTLLLLATGAFAQRQLSPYEQDSIRMALLELGGAERESSPEGKWVESIEVVALDAIDNRDPVPLLLNWFHSTSRESVVRREVLIVPGQPYTQALADETERNLRTLPQLSAVLIVPLKGTQPGSVKILVVTKDVWSLRIATQPTFEGRKLTSLAIQPSETNLFGTHHVLAGNVFITPDSYWLGATYVNPRIGGSRIRGRLNANAVFNCDTGRVEGATGSFLYGQPLYSSYAEWSWLAIANWSSLVGRLQSTARQSAIRSICSGGDAEKSSYALRRSETMMQHGARFFTDRIVSVPAEYRQDSLSGQFVLTRSFFTINKLDISTGAQVDRRRVHWLDVEPEDSEHYLRTVRVNSKGAALSQSFEPKAFDADDLSAVLAERVPSGERRVSPYLQLHGYANRWLRTINYDTLGLGEDWRMGHEFYLRLFPSFHPLSSHDVFGTYASVAYSWPVKDGFFRALVAAHLEFGMLREGRAYNDVDGLVSDVSRVTNTRSHAIADADYKAALHFASPDFGVGRLVADVAVRYRPLQTFFGYVGTGGTDRLRGYDRFEFVDKGVVNSNLELRTRPLQVFSVLGGLALFYDAGGAFDFPDRIIDAAGKAGKREFRFNGGHSLGFGFRVLSPQLDRDVFRIDFGFPLERRSQPFGFVAKFYHAFSAPQALPPALLTQ